MNHIGPRHRLVLPIPIYQQLLAYIMGVEFEISGLGTIEVVKFPSGVDFLIRDVYLLPQTSSEVNTNLVPQGIADLMMMRMQQHSKHLLKFWWHSHGIIDAYWSNQDEKTIRTLGRSWMVSLVANRYEKMLARLDVYEPFQYSAPIPLAFDIPRNPTLEEQVAREIAEKVTYVKPPKEEKGEPYEWDIWTPFGTA